MATNMPIEIEFRSNSIPPRSLCYFPTFDISRVDFSINLILWNSRKSPHIKQFQFTFQSTTLNRCQKQRRKLSHIESSNKCGCRSNFRSMRNSWMKINYHPNLTVSNGVCKKLLNWNVQCDFLTLYFNEYKFKMSMCVIHISFWLSTHLKYSQSIHLNFSPFCRYCLTQRSDHVQVYILCNCNTHQTTWFNLMIWSVGLSGTHFTRFSDGYSHIWAWSMRSIASALSLIH